MIIHKKINRLCAAATAVMLLLAWLLFANGPSLLGAATSAPPYAAKLFDTSRVHTLDLVAKESDWQDMLDNAQAEEYISCTAVIDGESYKNVGIRPKGNSSLTTVAESDSDRYSFKLEFDHYDPNQSYHGLDKLCLNNCIQDNTYMKDYLCYRMMGDMGADAPLTSYVFITVNGQDWGLYIAAEGIEEAFALRSYGADYGQLYKPDSMDMGGGGRGAQRNQNDPPDDTGLTPNAPAENGAPGTFPGESTPGATGESASNNTERSAASSSERAPLGESFPGGNLSQGFDKDNLPGMGGFGGFGGMGGSSDVLLNYTTDDPEDYPNIFDNPVFDTVTQADQQRLIAALKKLGEGNAADSVNREEVASYFAVHNFVLNEDSYTGSIIHNYYLYEDQGLLSMVAWDYNLAFGGMGGGTATAAANSPIDSPVSSGDISQRPMVAWLFDSEEHTQLYHQAMDRLIAEWFESGYFQELMDQTAALIGPYVQRDPTAFCSYEDFTTAVETLEKFCLLRAQSIRGQLEGDIPSTSEGQAADSSAFVDASHLNLSDMGSQGGFGGPGGREFLQDADQNANDREEAGQGFGTEDPSGQENGGTSQSPSQWDQQEIPQEGQRPEGFQMPGGFTPGQNPQQGEAAQAGGWEKWALLAGSAGLLAAGLVFAKIYR